MRCWRLSDVQCVWLMVGLIGLRVQVSLVLLKQKCLHCFISGAFFSAAYGITPEVDSYI